MPTVDILDQPTVVEATNDVAVVAFTEANVTVEVPSPAPVVEFASSASGLIVAGTGLTGGGSLIGNVSLALSAASIASLAKAETAIQPGASVSTFLNDAGYLTAATVEGNFQPLSDDLTFISNLTTTVFGRSFLELADAAAARTLLGVYGTADVYTKAEVGALVTGFAAASHTHDNTDIVSVAWSKLTGIPTLFPPGAHTHLMADITDLNFTADHGGLTGLADDDHPQYHTDARGDARYSLLGHTHAYADAVHTHLWADITDKPLTFAPSSHTHLWADITDKPTTFTPVAHVHAAGDVTSGVFSTALLGTGTANSGTFLRGDGTWAGIPGGVTDHGALTGLADDDHTQYHTDARGDVRYSLLGHTHDYAASSHTHSYLPLAGGTLTGTLNGTHGIFANSVRSDYFYSSTGDKLALQLTDNWLRLNQSAHFTSGVYTPGLFRADGGLKAGYDGTRFEVGAEGTSIQRYYVDNVPVAYHEWYVDQGTGGIRPIYLRFHQGNVWYNRLKLESDKLSYVGGADEALAAAEFRQLYLKSTGSHFTMYETDGADPADRGIVEVNSGILNLYTHDASANAWYQPLAASIATGNVWLGTDSVGAVTIRGATASVASPLYIGNNVYMQNNPLVYGYGGALNANDYWTTSQYATLRWTHFTAISGGSSNVPETPNNANGLLSLGKHTGGYTAQLFFPDNTNIWHRNQSAGTWGSWYKLFSTANAQSLWNDMLDATHGAYTDFNAVARFGPVYIQGTTNGPATPSATQYYAWSQGLGSNYGYDLYAAQFAIPRTPLGGHPVLSVRFRENGTWGAWEGVASTSLRVGSGGISVDNGTQWRITTANGYGDFGPANVSWFHMSTDRGAFYMGNALHVSGPVYRYGTNYAMDSDGFYFDASANRIRASSGTYGTGELYGSKNSWAGLRIVSAAGAPYLMWSTSSNVGGIYSETYSWMLYYTGSQWQGPSGQALLMSNFSGSGIVSRGTAAPSGGSDGDIYLQYT